TADFKFSPEQEAFFEQKVRPLLVAQCLECHGEKKQEGGLRLDSRPAILKGNESGPAIVAGRPEESRLIEVIGYDDVIKMPPKKKLADADVALLTEWIKVGAPFPAAAASSIPALGASATPEGIARSRATHWAFQPIRAVELPTVRHAEATKTAIDRFLLATL